MEMHACELFLSPRPDMGSQKLWGQPLNNHIIFQQVIPKSCLFLFKPGGRGDTEISGATSMEDLETLMYLELNNPDPEKSNDMAKER